MSPLRIFASEGFGTVCVPAVLSAIQSCHDAIFLTFTAQKWPKLMMAASRSQTSRVSHEIAIHMNDNAISPGIIDLFSEDVVLKD